MGFQQSAEVLRISPIREEEEPIEKDDDAFSDDSIEHILESDLDENRENKKWMKVYFLNDEDQESSPSNKEESKIYIMAKRIKMLENQIRIMAVEQQKLQGRI